MTILLILGFAVLLVLLVRGRRNPSTRFPAAALAILLILLALVKMLRTEEKPITRFYRSIDGAAGNVMASRMRSELPESSGTVVLLQFANAGERIDHLVREQRRGVEEALDGTSLTIRSLDPDAQSIRRKLSENPDATPWGEEELRALLSGVDNTVAVISFIGIPAGLSSNVVWPPMYVLQLDPESDYRALMERGIVKAVARTNGRFSPMEVPESSLPPKELFELRYELVTTPSDL